MAGMSTCTRLDARSMQMVDGREKSRRDDAIEVLLVLLPSVVGIVALLVFWAIGLPIGLPRTLAGMP